MANQNERIQISCSYAEFRVIHQAVVAAAVRLEPADRTELRNVLLRLGEADGITTHHLSDLTLWDVA